MFENSKLILESGQQPHGRVAWRSPSNIALIKYWGKFGNQLPRNPSISFTLDEAHTNMVLQWEVKNDLSDQNPEVHLYFEGENHPDFERKIQIKLSSLLNYFPFLGQLKLTIDSVNSFPHSAGIASSASSMSALALCLCSLEHELFGTLDDDDLFERKASYIARLLSGSACRSIYSTSALWGEFPEITSSSNLYAVPMDQNIHDIFKDFHNSILIVSTREKSVSSSEGHKLMESHPYAQVRYGQAHQRMSKILSALRAGDVETFGLLLEQEALTLHAMMMASQPPYILMEPATVQIIKHLQSFREDTGIPAYFTLDAGPNIHLLYPSQFHEELTNFIVSDLSPLCAEGAYIADKVGEGPVQLL